MRNFREKLFFLLRCLLAFSLAVFLVTLMNSVKVIDHRYDSLLGLIRISDAAHVFDLALEVQESTNLEVDYLAPIGKWQVFLAKGFLKTLYIDNDGNYRELYVYTLGEIDKRIFMIRKIDDEVYEEKQVRQTAKGQYFFLYSENDRSRKMRKSEAMEILNLARNIAKDKNVRGEKQRKENLPSYPENEMEMPRKFINSEPKKNNLV